MNHIEKLIHQIPKAELHCHIEGTLEPDLMFQLAERNKIKIPFKNEEEVKKAYEFTDLQSFLDIYYEGAKVLITEQDFYDLTLTYLRRAQKDNICHTEIFFDPQTHTQRGVAFETVFYGIHAALEEGEKKWGITSKLIVCFLRDLSEQAAYETFKQALPFKEHIVAVGLDSAEKNNPPEKFQHVYEDARKEGFLCVAHAGEEGPASYIWQALDLLRVKRIDHGIRCLEDPTLIQFLREKQIPLTVCPLSNVKLKVFNHLQEHNLKALLQAGLCVTINSDDPAYFGGYLVDNFLACHQAFGLSENDVVTLAKNSIEASFLEDHQKSQYRNSIEKAVADLT